jgi:hypothetical protein
MISAKNMRVAALAMALLIMTFAEAQAQRRLYPRLSLEFGVNYALFSPDELNNFIARLNREKIENGFGVRGGLRVQVSKHFDFNAKIGYVTGVSKADLAVTDTTEPEPIAIVQDEYRVRTIPVSIGVGGRIPLKALSLRAEFNIEHHIARVQYKIPPAAGLRFDEFQTKAKSNGPGFSFAVGPEWRPLALLAFNAKAGYRSAKISDFLSESSGLQSTLLPIEFKLDLSGVFFEAGVQFHP